MEGGSSINGLLRVHCVEAKLTHDTETFGKMDPYVKFSCREQQYKTTVAKDMGKHPQWNGQHFDIHVHYMGDDIKFVLWDDDVGKDELIGEGETKIASLANEGGFDEWF